MTMQITNRRGTIRRGTLEGALIVLILFLTAACGAADEAGTRVGNPPTVETTQAFPSNLAVASPLQTGEDFTAAADVSAYLADGEPLNTRAYEIAVNSIDAILNGETIADCRFDPSPIVLPSRSVETDADCYGPFVAYENHPDASVGGDMLSDGVLPPGDVGIWTENEEETGEACAAAQFNSQMLGLQFKVQVALEALASLVCVINVDNDLEMPDSGGSVEMTEEMNDMAATNDIAIAVTSAELALGTEEGRTSYEYALIFTYSGSESGHDIVIRMTHVPLDDEGTTYKGRFYFSVNREDSQLMNCPTSELTEAGSVLYNLSAPDDLVIRSDKGIFCGEGVDAMAVSGDKTGLIDPADRYDAATNTDGWGLDWALLIADFDPTTDVGDYVFAWQAGYFDMTTRTFNVTLAGEESDLTGMAFFGFGADVEESVGAIDGFICNYTGPGNEHFHVDDYEPVPYTQRQGLIQGADGRFVSDSASLAITYAPTNSCSYDGTGDFTFDSDGDGTVDTDPVEPIVNGLLQITDADGDGIFDEFGDAGFTLPAGPENF